MLAMLGVVLWVGCLICFVIVLIKLFQTQGIIHGILGLICGLYAFIWGWIHATELNLRNIMMIWSLLIILSIVVNYLSGGFYYPFSTPTVR